MKKLYMIGGTMGVGKTATCQELKHMLPDSVFLDGDWCWDADPFVVNDETKAMVQDNICYLLNNFLRCSVYENVIFCWVMHQQEIIDGLLAKLEIAGCDVKCISLVCSEEALRARLRRDVESGVRQPDVMERSIARISMYDLLDTIKIDTSALDVRAAAQAVAAL